MNLLAALGAAVISAFLSLIALVAYLFSQRGKRLDHRYRVEIPNQREPLEVVAKDKAQAEEKARRLAHSSDAARCS